MRHANISVFVPHLGCPNDCSFCNQRYITGQNGAIGVTDIEKAVIAAANSLNFNPEITELAFFGGSFTAIERDYMLSLLEAAERTVHEYNLFGIRISTRPDAIDNEVLDILKKHHVTSIELGAQSMDDNVLRLNNRGHRSQDVVTASRLIKDFGFELGLQMMTGLYGDTEELSLKTAERLIELKPDTVRIYPTIILKNTRLAELYEQGVYKPQELSDAVALCVTLGDMFSSSGIRVIRTGLHSIDASAYVAGPWHPAFSELCETEKIYRKIIGKCKKNTEYNVYVNPSDISKAVGQKRSNLSRLTDEKFLIHFIQDNSVNVNNVIIKEVN